MKCLITISLILCFITGNAQKNYKTIKVEGCVNRLISDACITKGDEVTGNETIRFQDPDDLVILMDTSGQLYTLRAPDTTGYFQGRELRFTLAEALKIKKQNGDGVATRGSSIQAVSNLKEFFSDDRFALIGDEARFSVSVRTFPISKEKFLVLYYSLDTTKVAKRLGFRDQVVRIQKSSLNEYNDSVYKQDIINNVSLYYYEAATKSTELLTSFDLVFVNLEMLNADFAEVYRNLPDRKKNNKEELTGIFESFFYNSYGNTDPLSLKFAIDEFIKSLNP